MPVRFLSIKNYETYQHYTKRNPPWIKLHLSILDDPDFLDLPDASKWHYIGLILLASRHENSIKPDKMYIKNRLGLKELLDLTPRFLREHVLASSASKLLACSDKFGDSEAEERRDRGEGEAQKDKEADALALQALKVVPIKIGKRKLRPIADDDAMTDKHRSFALTLKIDPGPEWGKFKNHCLANDRRYANFEAAFRNWLARAAEMKGERRVL